MEKTKGSKLSIYWTGPWIIDVKISDVVFIIKTLGNWNKKELAMKVGIDKIKQFNTDSIPLPRLNLDANSILPFDMFAEHQQDTVENHDYDDKQPKQSHQYTPHYHNYTTRSNNFSTAHIATSNDVGDNRLENTNKVINESEAYAGVADDNREQDLQVDEDDEMEKESPTTNSPEPSQKDNAPETSPQRSPTKPTEKSPAKITSRAQKAAIELYKQLHKDNAGRNSKQVMDTLLDSDTPRTR